ncbi:glycosyltransferase [Photobacterium damselae]|uniref:glycosyltransferase n=1 Tax=Photobacterium damselae TaxID=38293 RepID=UPI0035A91C64
MLNVSIIIPTYRDWFRLSLCLDALVSQSYPCEKIQIIVVNNDPDNVREDIIKKFKNTNILFIDEIKAGSYAARNTGLKYAVGDIVAFTDSDCIPDSEWLTNAVSFLENNKNIDRIGGHIELFFKSKKRNLAEIYEACYAFRQEEFVEKQNMAATANMITYKKLFDHVGNFNDKLMSGGDAEWGKRASLLEYKIAYCNNVIVRHPSRDSISGIFLKNRREAAGKIKEDSKIYFVLELFKSFLPPLKSIYYIRRKNIKYHHVLLAFIIRYILRIDSGFEKFKVGMLGKNVERL